MTSQPERTTSAAIEADQYEAPHLRHYGPIESWTQGSGSPIIALSLII